MSSLRSVLAFIMLLAALVVPASAQELDLRRVMLSAGGVGYFEYEAQVAGDARLALSVRLDQVDDVLKSIVVYDDAGVAGTIRLPGRDAVTQIFRDLPFGPEALSSAVALLNALPGARIRASGQRRIEGRLVRVVPESAVVRDGNATITRHRVSVMSEGGLRSFLLEESDAVTFVDPRLQAQVDAALAAVSAHRARDRRTLEILSTGQGQRTVRVGYVVAAPLWKASYRMTLDEAPADAARLQGWAVLENMSGQDWSDVELTLVSGNPVTFRQALYTAYYARRPEVPVEILGRVLPVPDTGALDLDDALSAKREQEFRRAQRVMADEADASEERVAGGAGSVGRSNASIGIRGLVAQQPAPAASAVPMAPPPPRQARILAAASSEAATSVSFRIPYPVSVSSGQSLLVPVIDRPVPATRVSLYQPATHQRHPLAAVRLRNDGETGLPPGVLTLYERAAGASAFIGDAQLSPLPAGEERLVSYALDQKTVVDREADSSRRITRGRIAKGVMELTYSDRQSTLYRLQAPPREARELLVEHPRTPGWKLDEPATDQVELTGDHYRIPRSLAAGARQDLKVAMSRPVATRLQLSTLRFDQYAGYAETGELNADVRQAFREMGTLRQVVDDHERRAQDLERERAQIHEEQKRIRDNLSRVPRDSDLHRRYIAKLNSQEDLLERLQQQLESQRDAVIAARKALGDYIQSLDL